ncbi:PREDICTED: R-spondin-4 isoform X1 [Gavialis gangeticus]|uniref:R-spondin-4 isoform X1 n=1 Tax=Gavialis gangeticus TaxID=94835 RepID=UPI00092EBF81|nr:PREDICTED: R-spondin-4 isoform X1 [Gavialis gangeticus]
MQWIIFMFLLFINSMEMLTQTSWRKRGTARRGLLSRLGRALWEGCGVAGRVARGPERSWPGDGLAVSTGLFENCTGCILCSEDNGCMACQQRLFLLIWRKGIRQYGACVHTCPPGYFGVRGQEVNRCTKCTSPSCESCFSKDFCMKCKERFYLHKGKCLSTCPPSTTAQPSTRECQEACELGPWSEWSTCTNEGRTCGCKWGLETRARSMLGGPKEEEEEAVVACPGLLESRKCRMRKHCPGEKSEARKRVKKAKKQKKQKEKKADVQLGT